MITGDRNIPMLAAAFSEAAGGTMMAHPGHWELTLGAGARVDARVVDSWLVMTSPVAVASPAAEMLGWNAILPAWVKFALNGNGESRIRSEIPIDEEPDSVALIREALNGFEAAHAILSGGDLGTAQPATLNAISQSELKRLCDEAGWSSRPRGENAVAVELESRGAYFQASFATCDNGLRAAVDLRAGEAPEAEAEEAIGLFLLAAASEIRMARPSVESIAGTATTRFEFVFSATPCAGRLAHAFSALSVACQVCAAELKALRNPDVASDFMALRSRSKTRGQSVGN